MGRLITEEAVYEYLTSKFDEFNISIFENEFAGKILDGLGDITTAYDVEKAVEEIEKLDTYKYTITSCKHPFTTSKYELVSKKRVIAIVKRGGV